MNRVTEIKDLDKEREPLVKEKVLPAVLARFCVDNTDGEEEITDFDMLTCFHRKNPVVLMLAAMGGILFRVASGRKMEAGIALGWYKSGMSVCGTHICRYYYTNFYSSLSEVLSCTLLWKEKLWREAMDNDTLIKGRELSETRQMLMSQSVKSYYISSMLLQFTGIRLAITNG